MTEQEHYWGGETRNFAVEDGEFSAVICKPTGNKYSGLTFIVGAANIPLSKYTSMKETLVSMNNVVIGIYVNVLSIKQGINHRGKARNLKQIFNQVKDEFGVTEYNIVGHSIGAKIALLVAALHDDDKTLNSVIAFDPVDQTPSEFTKQPPKGKKVNDTNLSLLHVHASITMTVTESGFFISKNHNARAIFKLNRSHSKIDLISHRNAGHMAYCDDDEGGYSWKAVMSVGGSRGEAERNKEVRTHALDLIQQHISGKVRLDVSQRTGKRLQDMKNGFKLSLKEIKKDVKSATSGPANKLMMKSVLNNITK